VLAHTDDPSASEGWFVQALERADQLGAPMLQLRAAMALARLWGAHGQVDAAASVLRVAYDRLTEGFATPDLLDARRLLEELNGAG
jgi:predicted ATPase